MLKFLPLLCDARFPNKDPLLSELINPGVLRSINGSGWSFSSGSLALYNVESELDAWLSCEARLSGLSSFADFLFEAFF